MAKKSHNPKRKIVRPPAKKWGMWNWADAIMSKVNLIDLIIGIIQAYPWYDIAQLKIPRADLNEQIPSHARIKSLLKSKGVKTFWPGFDGGYTYLRVRRRQANWARWIIKQEYDLEV